MMTLKEQLKFYLTTFHTGAMNIMLHVVSIIPLYWGFSQKNITIIVFGFSLDGLGHVYNYFCLFDERNKRKSLEIIPLVLVLGFILCSVLMIIFDWF